jgi:acetyl esterase/lipase
MAMPPELSQSAPKPDATVPYGPGPDQVIDLMRPRGPQTALVVMIHGGFWRAAFDRTHLGLLSDDLTRAGYAVALPEYRRVGQDTGGWPGTFDDIAAALDALPRLAPENGVSTDHIVLAGHSAGGHLALWAAARHRLGADTRWHTARNPALRGVVSLAGCCDLALCSEWELGDRAVHGLLGGPPAEQPHRYAQADPAALPPLGVPTQLVHGTSDDRVPVEMSRHYARQARAAGDAVELHEVPGADHFDVIDPRSDAWPEVRTAIAALA